MSPTFTHNRVVYRVVELREDSLQLLRPNPVVQQQARPLRVTTACIHIYGFKQYLRESPTRRPGRGAAHGLVAPCAAGRPARDSMRAAAARCSARSVLQCPWGGGQRFCGLCEQSEVRSAGSQLGGEGARLFAGQHPLRACCHACSASHVYVYVCMTSPPW